MNAFLLAGGQSTRMGRDKALLEFQGRPLIEHALSKLRALGFTPGILGTRQDLARFAPVIPDNYPACGPLGGIEAALAVTDEDLNLFLPVDLPLLPAGFLRWIAERATQTAALATIPRLQDRPQPLCAVYSRALLPFAQAALANGNARVMRAVETASAITGKKIDAFDAETIASTLSWITPLPTHRWFQNLNTPADLEKAALEETARIH